MSVGRVDLELRIGLPVLTQPAPGWLMRALRGVEVTQRDSVPWGFQLTFLAEPVSPADDFAVTTSPLLQPFSRVILTVSVDGEPTTLIDGFITHQQHMPGNGPGDSTFVVTGEDLSLMMDLTEISLEFPAMDAYMVVLETLAPWAAMGVVPIAIPPLSALVPVDYVPQQRETDRAFLQRLAQENGYVFYVAPTPVPYVNNAYWGPPPRLGVPSVILDVAVGPASNVESFSAEYDRMAPTTYWGFAMEREVEPFVPIPVITDFSTRLPPLALLPGLLPGGLLNRRRLWPARQEDEGLDPITANFRAQALTDLSTDEVVKVTCEALVERLGTVVCAPGIAGVRGTGEMYDGLYYVRSATHSISLLAQDRWDYRQQLVMTREGIGSTVPVLEAL